MTHIFKENYSSV